MDVSKKPRFNGDWIDIKISNKTFTFREIHRNGKISYAFLIDITDEPNFTNFGFDCDSYSLVHAFFEFIGKKGLVWKKIK